MSIMLSFGGGDAELAIARSATDDGSVLTITSGWNEPDDIVEKTSVYRSQSGLSGKTRVLAPGLKIASHRLDVKFTISSAGNLLEVGGVVGFYDYRKAESIPAVLFRESENRFILEHPDLLKTDRDRECESIYTYDLTRISFFYPSRTPRELQKRAIMLIRAWFRPDLSDYRHVPGFNNVLINDNKSIVVAVDNTGNVVQRKEYSALPSLSQVTLDFPERAPLRIEKVESAELPDVARQYSDIQMVLRENILLTVRETDKTWEILSTDCLDDNQTMQMFLGLQSLLTHSSYMQKQEMQRIELSNVNTFDDFLAAIAVRTVKIQATLADSLAAHNCEGGSIEFIEAHAGAGSRVVEAYDVLFDTARTGADLYRRIGTLHITYLRCWPAASDQYTVDFTATHAIEQAVSAFENLRQLTACEQDEELAEALS